MTGCDLVDKYGDFHCLVCSLPKCVLDDIKDGDKRLIGRPLGGKNNTPHICPVCGNEVNRWCVYRPYCCSKCKWQVVGEKRDTLWYSELHPDPDTYAEDFEAVNIDMPYCSIRSR